MSENNSYTKGFVFGALIGGAVGAITALLLAPKPGSELRQELAEKAKDAYDKSAEYIQNVAAEVSPTIENTVNEGKIKAQGIVSAAKKQADELLSNADSILNSAKLKAQSTKDNFTDKFDTIRDAAKAGVETFKSEING